MPSLVELEQSIRKQRMQPLCIFSLLPFAVAVGEKHHSRSAALIDRSCIVVKTSMHVPLDRCNENEIVLLQI